MKTATLASAAYASPREATLTPRQAEYRAFAQVTSQLSAAGEGDSFPELAEALHENLKLWTVLAVDVAQKENALPADLRGRLFYLSEFTRAHSLKVLSGDESVDALIDVNTAVMKGLRGEVETA